MARIFSSIYLLVITFQCYAHYTMAGYNHSIIFWWLINFGIASLLWDGYRLKK